MGWADTGNTSSNAHLHHPFRNIFLAGNQGRRQQCRFFRKFSGKNHQHRSACQQSFLTQHLPTSAVGAFHAWYRDCHHTLGVGVAVYLWNEVVLAVGIGRTTAQYPRTTTLYFSQGFFHKARQCLAPQHALLE